MFEYEKMDFKYFDILNYNIILIIFTMEELICFIMQETKKYQLMKHLRVGDGLKLVKGLAIPFSIMYKIFCADYRVYVFSRRNNLPKGFSTEDMANDIIKHMEKLNIANAYVIGVSQAG